MGKHFLRRLFAIAAFALLAFPATAGAQNYPSRVITMVVPFPAGGGTTLLGRVVAEQMKAELGQTVIVENAPGAGGTIGVAKVARAIPDGYKLLFGNWASNVGTGAVYPVDYDLLKDFAPIARIAGAALASCPQGFSGNGPQGSGAFAEGQSRQGRDGDSRHRQRLASVRHLSANETGIRVQFIPYHGGPPAIQDLIGGHVDMMCDFSSTCRRSTARARSRRSALWPSTDGSVHSGGSVPACRGPIILGAQQRSS
jgi:tripartite-type tricarboxylate transporter receptor subunit TctC